MSEKVTDEMILAEVRKLQKLLNEVDAEWAWDISEDIDYTLMVYDKKGGK